VLFRSAEIVGSWQCFGPLTGRGMTLVFGADGSLGGQMDGRPVSGRYALRERQLFLQDAGGTQRFAVEEQSSDKLILNAGSGRRMVCNR
jgi:hypothetical protein